MTQYIVLSSTYPCLGKDTLLKQLTKDLNAPKPKQVRVGDLIKSDCLEIVNRVNQGESLSTIAPDFDATPKGLERALSGMTPEEYVLNDPWIKGPGQRILQQNLGLDLHDNEYWVNRLKQEIETNSDHPFLVSAGVRLVPEADLFHDLGFYHIRIEGSRDLAKSRSMKAYGVTLDDTALDHPVERALDNYDKFDFTSNATQSASEQSARIIEDMSAKYLI